MNKETSSNIVVSVRQRLLNIIRETGDDANLIWSRYATERLLYRLSVSEYAGEFVLKGAMLFVVWTGQSYRPTMDLDLLGYGEDSSERVEEMFRNVCCVGVEPDGLLFDPEMVKSAPIREDQEYQGQRITLVAFLGRARIPVQVDIGFGDVVTPNPKEIIYPTLLDFADPRICACPRETVVAEKLQAMVALGIANSRMKDFYDLYVLARNFAFDGATLTRAIKATFKRRKTRIPTDTPLALTEEFARDATKAVQWKAFVRKSSLEQSVSGLVEVCSCLREFLLSPLKAASGQGASLENWDASGPWAFQKSNSGDA
jgi:predicted nucleotidyltransferase component of viral defense system